MQETKLQIAYFPYLFMNVGQFYTFSGITVQHLENVLNSVKEEKLRKRVAGLMGQNQIRRKPIKSIGIVTIKGKDTFRPLTLTEQRKVAEFRKVIFVAAIAKCNTGDGPNVGHTMITSDNFRLAFQNFVLESPYTGYQSGRIIAQSDFGYRVNEIAYEKPSHVLTNTMDVEEGLLVALGRLRRINRKMYGIILTAVDSLMNAYTNSEDVSHESRILELSRAFEILLQLPEKDQRKVFKQAIGRYCISGDERPRRYLSERTGKKRVPEIGTPQQMWADRFYVLRNHIIHGDVVPNRSYMFKGQFHVHLGLWFFMVAMKQVMNERLREKVFYDSVQCKSGKFVYNDGFLSKVTNQIAQKLQKRRQAQRGKSG